MLHMIAPCRFSPGEQKSRAEWSDARDVHKNTSRDDNDDGAQALRRRADAGADAARDRRVGEIQWLRDLPGVRIDLFPDKITADPPRTCYVAALPPVRTAIVPARSSAVQTANGSLSYPKCSHIATFSVAPRIAIQRSECGTDHRADAEDRRGQPTLTIVPSTIAMIMPSITVSEIRSGDVAGRAGAAAHKHCPCNRTYVRLS